MKYQMLLGVLMLALSLLAPAQDGWMERHLVQDAGLTAATAALAADPGSAQLKAEVAKFGATGQNSKILKSLIGDNWRTVIENSTFQNKADEIGKAYKTNPIVLPYFFFSQMSTTAQRDLATFVAAKETLVKADLSAIEGLPYTPAFAERIPEIVALLPSGSIRGYDYYNYVNKAVLKRGGKTFSDRMKTGEWIDMALANSHIDPAVFVAGREFLILRITKSLMDKRKADGLSTEGPEFEAALAPMLAALRAPLFAGLRNATVAAGLDFGVPEVLDWTNATTIAAAVQDAAVRQSTFTTAWGVEVPYEKGLGTVMLVLGETGYEAWRVQVLSND